MSVLWVILGLMLILIILGDAFETIVLPRRVTRRIRLVRLFYRTTWSAWSSAVRYISSPQRRENYLSFYGPFSLILLLIFWATGLVIGFALLHWASGSPIKTPDGDQGFGSYLYLSGTTFFTLGLGDLSPGASLGRAIIALEGGMGFGFLALVISYLPIINQSFSRREANISLLDARAGSPPTAGEILRRHGRESGFEDLRQLLQNWEGWSSEFLESHLSYPVLAYFRSQHDNQSWLGSLSAIMDTCALILAGIEGAERPCTRQAQLTFAMARHAVVDLGIIFGRPPRKPDHDRLPPDRLRALRALLEEAGFKFPRESSFTQNLKELRETYEPYVHSLSHYLGISLPPWMPQASRADNWQTSVWEVIPGEQRPGTGGVRGEHF